LIITSANVERFSDPVKTLCYSVFHLNCVATLPCEIQKSTIMAKLLLIPSKLLDLAGNLT